MRESTHGERTFSPIANDDLNLLAVKRILEPSLLQVFDGPFTEDRDVIDPNDLALDVGVRGRNELV
jgi:hypothetical protein